VKAGFDVRLEVERTVPERREECLEVGDAAVTTPGTSSCQCPCDVSGTAQVAVVFLNAPVVHLHPAVASVVDEHDLVGGTLHL